jgi:hypothetical protein
VNVVVSVFEILSTSPPPHTFIDVMYITLFPGNVYFEEVMSTFR